MVCRAEARRRGRHVARLSNPTRKRGKQMRAWLYYRLSRDEDEELNSLTNQRSIIAGYAEKNGFTIAGESFDDNVSGMHCEYSCRMRNPERQGLKDLKRLEMA